MIRNLKILFFVVLCLSLGSCKKIIKSSDNFIEHKVLSKGGKEISKEAAERSAKEFGNSYVGKSAGHQLVRNAVRKKVEKEMEEEGVKSFLQFGSKKASKKLARFSASPAKLKVLKEKNTYHDHIIALRKNSKQLNQEDRIFKDAAIKEVKIVSKKEGKEALEYLSNHDKELAKLVDKISRNPRTPTMKYQYLVVEISEDGKKFLSYKEFPNSKIEVDGNIIRATAGAKNKDVYKGVNTGLNEFLSYRLPNKTYIIDDYMRITTDDLGNVKETVAVFEKKKIVQRMRNTPDQTRIVESQGGVVGRDDGGHLIQMGMGGPNELLNQVPMNKQVNRSGIWKKVEKYEIEQGWEQGKKVITKRRPIYKGNTGRPIAIEVDVIVDGKHAVIDGKQCPFIIQNP